MSVSLESLPVADQNDICAICQCDFSEDRDAVGHSIGNWTHLFHRNCMEQWMQQRESCPLCSRNVAWPETFKSRFRRFSKITLIAAGAATATALLTMSGIGLVGALTMTGATMATGRILATAEGKRTAILASAIATVGALAAFEIESYVPEEMVEPLALNAGSICIGLVAGACADFR